MTVEKLTTQSICFKCGRRIQGDQCQHCGARVSVSPPRQLPRAEAPQRPNQPVNLPPTSHRAPQRPITLPRPAAPTRQQEYQITGQSQIEGRVIRYSQAGAEPMDPDLWRWVALLTWTPILFTSPVLALIALWPLTGFFFALVVSAVFLLFQRFIFSRRLLEGWRLTSALNGRRIVETMPVVSLRIRTTNGTEAQIRLKGFTNGILIQEGDRVTATGRMRDGALQARSVTCHRTGAIARPTQPNSMILALAGLATAFILVLWIFFGAIPLLLEQFTSPLRTLQNYSI